MKIKDAKGPDDDLSALQALLDQGAPASLRSKIDQEMRRIRIGWQGEREAAYEIDFHHGPSRNWAVIHDLRIEHEGRVAQIDHLLIGRFLDFWVCETKQFRQGIAINEFGEFTRFVNGRPEAMPSPLEQNRKHLSVLDAILRSDKITLPTRLGITLRPQLHSVIVVGKDARITRPKTRIQGIDRIVKSDQLRALIERSIEDESMTSSLMTVGKVVSPQALESLARQVARLHRPLRRDWAARFGLDSSRQDSTPLAASDAPAAALAAREADTTASARGPADERASVPTSKLGAAHGLPNVAATLTRLREAGLLERVGDEDRLTQRGHDAGGRFVEKSRYGPYFTWPRDLKL